MWYSSDNFASYPPDNHHSSSTRGEEDSNTIPLLSEIAVILLCRYCMCVTATAYYPTTRIRPASSIMVPAKSFPDRSRPLSFQPTQMASRIIRPLCVCMASI